MEHLGYKVFNQYGQVAITSWLKEDIMDYSQLVQDPEVMRYIGNGATRTVERAAQEIERFNREIEGQGWTRFALRDTRNNRCIGYGGFKQTEMGIDYGGRILKRYWGTPFAFTGLYLGMEYGFDRIGFDQVYTISHIENQMAIKLLRKFFQLPISYGNIIQTPHGPHLKMDYTREMFENVRERNVQIVQMLANRYLRVA